MAYDLPFQIAPRPTRSLCGARFNMLKGPLAFFGTAALSGIIFHTLFFSLNVSNTNSLSLPRLQLSSWWSNTNSPECSQAENYPILPTTEYLTSTPVPIATVFKDPWAQPNDMTLEEIREMVSKTKGFFARDFSLGLGWNNIRYILEAALLHATMLNRTLVIPSFVYCRSCEFDIHSCAAFVKMVDRGKAVGSNEWQNRPHEEQVAWRIPIGIMLDIPRLRKKYPVILVSEYLQIQGLPINYEQSNGHWHREIYHSGSQSPSIYTISNLEWDPKGVIRVDRDEKVEKRPALTKQGQRLATLLQEERDALDKAVLNWSETRLALSAAENATTDDALERLVHKAGWTILHTYEALIEMEYTKAVVEPSRQVAPLHELRGVIDDWNHISADVLHLAGEIHLSRKPGFLRFTTPEARDAFSEMVLESFRPTEEVMALARKISYRMTEINGGRQWVGAHMRRGDFVRYSWVMEPTLEAHVSRVMRKLETGKEILEQLKDMEPKAYNVSNSHINDAIRERPTPLANDTIYIATDERDQAALEYIREHRALVFNDLVTVHDRREFGWPIMLTDVVALVEQAVLGTGASYFYAHALSSVAGGALNLRAISGMDARTALVD